MPDSSDQRALATRLPSLSDARIEEALALRGVPSHAGWHDWFDAAEALLDGASIERALPRLSRAALRAIAEGDVVTDPFARAALLVDEEGMPYAAVRERVRASVGRADTAAPAAPPRTPEHGPERTPDDGPEQAPAASDETAVAASAERAFAAVGALADLVLATSHTPLVRTGAGNVGATDRRRLVEAGVVGDAEDLEDLAVAGEAAGLLRAGEREWTTTPAAAVWLPRPTAERWAEVASGLRAGLPSALRTEAGGYRSPAAWAAEYPLDPEWPGRAARLARLWRRWGLVADDGSEPPWAVPLRRGDPADPTVVAASLPPEIDRVYLQADLSAIAPGPLAPALDLRLRRITHRESRAQASTYRFSADSIGAALSEGETGASLLEFLSSLSLTGIPQPLKYLIDSTAARHGKVTVRTDALTGQAVVETGDEALRATIAVDQALRPLGLVADGGALVSRVSREAVYWSLRDARYPVVALDDDGDPLAVSRRARPAEAAAPPSPHARLIAALRAAGGSESDTDAAWLERELELAVRARSLVALEVRLPDGSTRALTLEASGLSGGRLRGRDRTADVERTLPVSSIVSARPLPAPPSPTR